ncbi:metallo-beta-lactamase/rhodanese-like domain-containing protein [Thioalkalivibrio nitratireducens DSM 14787]|uniref:Metallo-beta-lactamase/rhodanese-like domain-containing protein n=1 Tax=Thioalkalivibrio nitratireducens (strain DSM 14787 / UNIQEM 213 / ALEN2) TaxID=1255043 RepID=L0DSP6_THIND|nr:MBL fold metallo-hydrolase [Thioalkalivibrio nitratireducens]AGA32033.1 metallo-beta-lactamase/rhodanese-like domain-containing protein [Thioalkalivibrio nitratireducens DSM 14787]
MLKKRETAWTPASAWEHLLQNEPMFILDLRNADEFAQWRVEGPSPLPTKNIPYFELLDLDAEADDDDVTEAAIRGIRAHLMDELPADRTILAVCPEGHTSSYVAEALRNLDFEAVNLEGGMEAWGRFYYWRRVTEEERYSLYQVVRPARGCISHVLISDQCAAIFDPGRHIDIYHDLVAGHDASIIGVFDTHLHADHLSGGPMLGERWQVPYHLHPYDAIHPVDMVPAQISYEFLHAGQTIHVGQAEFEALHIPGHTLGMVAFLVEKRYLLTGDSLFLESIARPDLGGKAETWTPLLYLSLLELMQLDDDIVVLPGHFSDITVADPEGRYQANLGGLKTRNPGLAKVADGEEAFNRYILENLPELPDAYFDIKRANAGLDQPDEAQASELELGKNVCAATGKAS